MAVPNEILATAGMSVFQGPGTSATRWPSLSLQVPKVQTDRPPQSPPGCRAPSPPSNPSTPPASSPLRRQNPGSFVFSRAHLTTLSAIPPLSLLLSSSHRLEASSLPSLSPSSRRHNLCLSLPVAEFLSIANFNFIVAVRFSELNKKKGISKHLPAHSILTFFPVHLPFS